MNILVLSGSPRKSGNTDLLVQAFVKGAALQHQVEVVSVHDYKVLPCTGCNACYRSADHICPQKDDMTAIYNKMAAADMLVIASPVYFYGLSAQLKAIIDRCHNPIRDNFRIKSMALLLVGADTLPSLFNSILTQYKLCLDYFNLFDAGHVLVRGVEDKGDITHTSAISQAYEFGKSLSRIIGISY
jgi:multimeric flavodoxin WrbA